MIFLCRNVIINFNLTVSYIPSKVFYIVHMARISVIRDLSMNPLFGKAPHRHHLMILQETFSPTLQILVPLRVFDYRTQGLLVKTCP